MVVCYTGGGTLGHVFPALAVHEHLSLVEGYQAYWIGREEKAEREAVEQAGIRFFAVRSGKFRRYRSIRNITDIGNIFVAFFQSFRILRTIRPDVLFSKGGFVSVPPVLAAFILRIPVISHESDSTPGLATRINSRFSVYVCVPAIEGFEALGKQKLQVTGSPIRKMLLDAKYDKKAKTRPEFLKTGQKLILVLGGSSGAVQVNTLVRQNLDELCNLGFVYHQCGSLDAQHIEHDDYLEVPFIGEELAQLLAHADLVISRAGANTLAELALFACPSLLIPLSAETSRGDQIDNANRLAKMGAARVLLSQDISENRFLKEVVACMGDEGLRLRLGQRIGALTNEDSAQRIASLLLSVKE